MEREALNLTLQTMYNMKGTKEQEATLEEWLTHNERSIRGSVAQRKQQQSS